MNDDLVECTFAEDEEGYWIGVYTDGEYYGELGPFDTIEERERAMDNLLALLYLSGATDIPKTKH